MKAKNLLIVFFIALFFSGCVVYSFYPLYTEKDLFANEILTGEWFEGSDQAVKFNNLDATWNFGHPVTKDKGNSITDSISYDLVISDKDSVVSRFIVNVIRLGEHCFLDFYLYEFLEDDNLNLGSFHIIPVHTFAKLTVKENKLIINWFDQDWLGDLIKENKIRIHHEKNDDFILLTAKPGELQKFVTKYVNSEEAFKDGMEVILTRK